MLRVECWIQCDGAVLVMLFIGCYIQTTSGSISGQPTEHLHIATCHRRSSSHPVQMFHTLFQTYPRLSVGDPGLQRVHLTGPLRSVAVLRCHQGTPQSVQSRTQIHHHQIRHLLVILAGLVSLTTAILHNDCKKYAHVLLSD